MQSKKLPQLEEYETADAIFCTAIRDVMNEYSLQKEDIPIIYVAYLNILES